MQRNWKKYTNTKKEYKEAATRFPTEFMSNKTNYEQNLFTTDKTLSNFYGYVKTRTTANSSMPCMHKENGEYAVTDQEKAHEFSEYYTLHLRL